MELPSNDSHNDPSSSPISENENTPSPPTEIDPAAMLERMSSYRVSKRGVIELNEPTEGDIYEYSSDEEENESDSDSDVDGDNLEKSNSSQGQSPKKLRDTKNRFSSSLSFTGHSIFSQPNLQKAKEFGLSSRPHRIADPKQPTGYRLARPGEQYDISSGMQAEKYSVWFNSYKDFDEFGIGLSLYFRQLLFQGCVFLFITCIYLFTLTHYYNWSYAAPSLILQGSVWNAQLDDLSMGWSCIPDFFAVLFLVFCGLMSAKIEEMAANMVDENQQTAQDYAIMITNPPKLITDPDEYFEFFSKYGEIVSITIALNNGNLIEHLKEMRKVDAKLRGSVEGHGLLRCIKRKKEPDTKYTKPLSFYEKAMASTPAALYQAKMDLNEKIKVDVRTSYQVKRVYIIFNEEAVKIRAMNDLSLGYFQIFLTQWFDYLWYPQLAFHGRTLHITEPVEPSEIFWNNFHLGKTVRLLHLFVSLIFAAAFLTISYYLLVAVRNDHGYGSAIIISCVNVALPTVMRSLTKSFEIHLDYSDQQESMFFKLLVGRCLNTAILKFLVTAEYNWTETFQAQNLSPIVAILIADALTNPVISILNPYDRFTRWYFAPKAKTQREMNNYFLGMEWNLAERYTDMMKTIFVGLFYSSILPIGVLITALAMFVCYWVDKYNLFYQWQRPPAVDATLASRSRLILLLTIFAHVFVTRVFFANWPYTDLEDKATCHFLYCETDNMTFSTQRHVVSFYNIFGYIIGILTCIQILYALGIDIFTNCLKGNKKELNLERISKTKYKEIVGADSYVPCVKDPFFSEPFLAATLIDYPHSLLPLRQVSEDLQSKQVKKKNLHSRHDLPTLTEEERDVLFATCKFYGAPPVYKQPVFGVAVNIPSVGRPTVPQLEGNQNGSGGIAGTIDNTVTRAVYQAGLVPSHVTNPQTFVNQQMQNDGFNIKSQYNTNPNQGIQGQGPSNVYNTSVGNTYMPQSAPQREDAVKSSSPTRQATSTYRPPGSGGYTLPQVPQRQQTPQMPYTVPPATNSYTIPNPGFSFGPNYSVPGQQNPGAGLPPDWAHYTDSNGRVYYHNRRTNVTQWTRPMY